MTTWSKWTLSSVILAFVALPLHATIFGGKVGHEELDIVIQASPKGEVTGATLRLPYPKAVLPQPLPLRLITGTRRGNHVELQEWDAPGHETAHITGRIVRREYDGVLYEVGLFGEWRIGGHRYPVKLGADLEPPSILAAPEIVSASLDERLHADIRAGGWEAVEFDAHLLCGAVTVFCDWTRAVPILKAGGDPGGSAGYPNGYINPPWKALVLERQAKFDDALKAAHGSCQFYSRAGCFFYTDLASRLAPAQRREALHFACATELVGCKEFWGDDEVALVEAAHAGNIEHVQKLLAKGTRVNVGDGSLPSPLQAAVMARSLPVVEALLARGADVNRDEGEGAHFLTPLNYATFPSSSNEDIAILLLDHGAHIHAPHNDALLVDAALGHERRVVHRMLEMGEDPDHDTAPVGSALTVAVKNRDLPMIKDLLAHGASPDYGNKHSGGSPIDWAERMHQKTVLRLLLDAQKPKP